MKKIVRRNLVIFFSLYLISNLLGGINYHHDLIVLALASFCLYLLNLIAKPLLNLLFMPINLITLGASKWLINLIIIFLVTIFIDSFDIIPVNISTAGIAGFTYPSIHLSFIWSLILISFLIEALVSLINWLFS